MKYVLFISLCIFPYSIFAQFQDDFTDGNFTNNPTWQGDLSTFTINTNLELQLNDIAGGTAQMFVPLSIGDTTSWQFYLHLDFSPSNSNRVKVFLSSSGSDFEGTLNGYFLQIGETGTNDAIEIYRQDGTAKTLLFRAAEAAVTTNPIIGVQIRRSNIGDWELLVDYTGGTNYQLEGTFTDNTYTQGDFFGIHCSYTSTRKDKFFFDDFWVDPLFVDNKPPTLLNVEVKSDTEVEIRFDEPIATTTAENIFNYDVPTLGNPISASQDTSDATLVHLIFGTSFIDNQTYTLNTQNIADISGNITTLQTANFTYEYIQTAQRYDILINEIYADPTPSIGLPDAEYVELYNAADFTINLKDFGFSAGSTPALFPDYNLSTGDYLILCDIDDIAAFSSYGAVLGIDFPALVNSGDQLTLMDAENNVIHQVEYDITWYQNGSKDDGGYALELINPKNPCDNSLNNWNVSQAIIGGTPGVQNSVFNAMEDNTPLDLLTAFPESSTLLRLYFNKALDENTAIDISNYMIDNNISIKKATVEDFQTVLLEMNTPFIEKTIYTIEVSSLTDCIGNVVGLYNEFQFGLPEIIERNDLVINEVLFNPNSDGVDFVEIYNRSDKIINIGEVLIGNTTDGFLDNLEFVERDFLIFPETYVVVTENSSIIEDQYVVENPLQLITTNLPSYPDDDGGVVIVANGVVIDLFSYSNEMHHSLLDDENGVSLERINPEDSTQSINNWHSAAATVGYATPTAQNSQFMQTTTAIDIITIEEKVFSPDDDGFQDFLSIRYETDEIGCVATIQIYDANGRQIRQLIRNEILGRTGTLKWDGTTDNKNKAPLGIYIIWIEIVEPSGKVQRLKKTCVVAGR